MIRKVFLPTILFVTMLFNLKAADVVINDATINPGETYNMTANNTYILDGFVFVEEGSVLNIEAGTVIKGKQGEAENASALIIARGGKINANGTKENPIIFTSELDDTEDPTDLPLARAGLWGGVIILGNSIINTPGGTEQIEGIPTTDLRGTYGGDDAEDNSGVFRYVSIRHGGTNIGANNEINGLTMGGVGNGTVVEYVEVYANSDDGVEFFGGTVNTKYIAVVMCEDDSFDWDEGYSGKNQFWFSIQTETTGNNMGENDGATNPEDSQPYATPYVYNATYIGNGMSTARSQSRGFHLRDNSGGYYHNSIITELGGAGVDIEDLQDANAEDSRKRLETGDLAITNNIWWNIGGNTLEGIAPDVAGSNPYSQDFVRTYLGNNNNFVDNPMLAGISRTTDGGLDPRPNEGPAWTLARKDIPQDPFFVQTSYIGAFGEENWLEGWTFLSEAGILGDKWEGRTSTDIVVTDETIAPGQTYNMTANNTYILDGFVFVEEGSVLNIEAGTVIKGKQGEAENASALIIARGGKINANGTKENPIIFTSELDDTEDPTDLPLARAGLWGGVIILGNSIINTPGGTEQIEGIPTTDLRGTYGGDDAEDNSGVFRYVSIRHGGTNIGANNEINGLTMGGVGNGTVVEYVEVYANSDDGVEFFGGTVNTKYIAVVMCEDDSFDWDEGYSGKNQFWFSIQTETTGNNMGENDGATNPEDSQPYATPYVYNATYIGNGMSTARSQSRGFHLRDNSGGYYHNSIITELGGAGVDIEDLQDANAEDSRKRLETGDLAITNNIWWNIGGNTLEGIAPDVAGSNPYSQDFVRTYLGNNNNFVDNPMLAGISRTTDGGLDPRPNEGPAWTLARKDIPQDPFFVQTSYIGAFGEENWLEGWTFLSEAGIIGDLQEPISSVERGETTTANPVFAYPNPVETNITIEINIDNNSNATLELFNSIGSKVAVLENSYLTTGQYTLDYSVQELVPGAYFIILTTDYGTFTHQVVVK